MKFYVSEIAAYHLIDCIKDKAAAALDWTGLIEANAEFLIKRLKEFDREKDICRLVFIWSEL